MVEVQAHGFTFEKWVRDTIFEGYAGTYMQKWDIPPDINHHAAIPAKFQHLPVSIKACKYGQSINLGDILRQREVDHPFLMIAGFWRQRTPTEKWVEEIGVVCFSATHWASLWGTLSLAQLREIDTTVKNKTESYVSIQAKAKVWKRTTPEVDTSRITVNPKIDTKGQRRIQCSLRFAEFWRAVDRVPEPKDQPLLFGRPFPNPIPSSTRKFNS